MNKKKILIIVLVIVILLIVGIIVTVNILNKGKENTNSENITSPEVPGVEIDKNQVDYDNTTTVEELKDFTGASGDTELYEVTTEYDGRQVLKIKDNKQYDVAIAGIIKQEKPEFSEIEELKKNAPKKPGIWVSEKSRTNFLNLLNNQTNSKYKFNEEGYLEIEDKSSQNNIDKKLESLISGSKLFAINISGTDYTIDSVTGEIVENPFEQLDPYQAFDYVANDNSYIIIVTTNKEKSLSNKEILNSIIEQMTNA